MADGVEAVAVLGLGEIVPGDDLPALIADALASSASLLPLRDDDVLVVTQKVVSKAEGAIVDLTILEPRPDAIEFAERFDRDPRQVEVVLREARRIVRMANGVIITETVNPHSSRALKAFWVDLTDGHPLFHESLVLWHRLLGYAQTRVLFPRSRYKDAVDLSELCADGPGPWLDAPT